MKRPSFQKCKANKFQRHLKSFLVVTFCSIQYFQYIFGSFQTRGLNPRNQNYKSTWNPTQFNQAELFENLTQYCLMLAKLINLRIKVT